MIPIFTKEATLYRRIPDDKIHTVTSGQTLNGIAIMYGVSSAAIMARNNMANTNIFVGQKLTIPALPGKYRKNNYGEFILEPITIPVAIDMKKNVVRDREGAEVSTFLDVDIPADVFFDYGDELEYIDPFGRAYRGEVISLEENTDPLGIRVLSRFAQIG